MTEEQPPLVSVIIPIRNEADYIERSIGAVTRLDYPPDRVEILVVDGMSDDGTREVVERLVRENPRIRLLENRNRDVASAMNIGIAAAKGELFTRIDGHALVAPDFLRESVRCLQEHPDAWVVGGVIETVSQGVVGKAIAAAMRSRVGVGNSRFRIGGYEGWVDTLAFGTHHRWVVDRVGNFDETLIRNQDDEFNQRIRNGGGKIWLSPAIRSQYFARSSFLKLWRQYFQYGFWRVRTIQKHREAGSVRQLLPVLFVGALGVLLVASLVWPPAVWLLAGLAAAYGAFLVVGAVGVGREAGVASMFLAPFAFAILHFSYGFGFLWGLIRFGIGGGRGIPTGTKHALSR